MPTDSIPNPTDETSAAQSENSLPLDPLTEMERLRNDVDDAQNRYLRSQADLENYRKRTRREMDDERKYAFMPLLKDLLPVIDNLERALIAAQKNPEPGKIVEGIKMVTQQFEEMLGRHGVERIDALGKPFDPNLHQAIMQQPSAEHPADTVLQITQAGFQLHDRVVRPTQVIVSKAP